MLIERIRKELGLLALKQIKSSMVVGLGTGKAAESFIDSLILEHRAGLNVQVVCSSDRTLKKAKEGSLPIIDINEVKTIDITVDGADEVDRKKRMIKGAGGALFREKILAANSKEVLILIDESKLVEKLGKCKLPVEIAPFGAALTKKKLASMGFNGSFRVSDGSILLTDNGNIILDIFFDKEPSDIEEVHQKIKKTLGVIETGLFFNLPSKILVGHLNGELEVLS